MALFLFEDKNNYVVSHVLEHKAGTLGSSYGLVPEAAGRGGEKDACPVSSFVSPCGQKGKWRIDYCIAG